MSVHAVGGGSTGRVDGEATGVVLLTRRLLALVIDLALLGTGRLATILLGVSVIDAGVVD